MRTKFSHTYVEIIAVSNLLAAWQEFRRGKRLKSDVLVFQSNLITNILALHQSLAEYSYRHSGYQAFNISDPKPRHIHKATVTDRLVHHAVYRVLYPSFDRLFIADSFSCRKGKGTFKALARFKVFGRKVSRNNTKTCWVLKGDIKQFFASINQSILLEILSKYISDQGILRLLKNIIESFPGTGEKVGLPLGNLTSQLLVNIYLNEFDQFVKHQLKVKYYVRYADDFVLFSSSKDYLAKLLPMLSEFLTAKLKLSLNPSKVTIKTLDCGIDFLGWVNFPNYLVLRTATKRRMFKRLLENHEETTVKSYLGLLSHGNTFKLQQQIKGIIPL